MKGVEPFTKEPNTTEKQQIQNAGAAKGAALAAPAQQIEADLTNVVKAWPMLPEPVKAGILAMVKAVRPS